MKVPITYPSRQLTSAVQQSLSNVWSIVPVKVLGGTRAHWKKCMRGKVSMCIYMLLKFPRRELEPMRKGRVTSVITEVMMSFMES